ncbi:type II secretion system F family protein [soil metagenome]
MTAPTAGLGEVSPTPFFASASAARMKFSSALIDANACIFPCFGRDLSTVQLSFIQKEQFFHELGQLARSGIPLPGSLEMLGRSKRRAGRAAEQILRDLKASSSASEAFLGAGFDPSDGAVIEAGETTGRLDQVFEELEVYYQQLAEARSTIIRRSTYSVVVLHLGAVLLAIPSAILAGSFTTFLANSLPVLFVFYGAVIGALFGWRMLRGMLASSPAAAMTISRIPVLGGILTNLTAWKFSLVLSLYVRAGGGLLKAFNLAGDSCGNAIIKSACDKAVPRVQNGETLASAFCTQPDLPELLERSVEVGERSGRLDEETRRAADLYKKRTLVALDSAARAIPICVYIIVVGYTGYKMVMMMKAYYASWGSILDSASS